MVSKDLWRIQSPLDAEDIPNVAQLGLLQLFAAFWGTSSFDLHSVFY